MKKRKAKKVKRTPALRTRFHAILREALIVPENGGASRKPVLIAAGSVVEFMDTTNFFRDRFSPVTRRANELLVRWGPRGKEALGWMASNTPYKAVKGPLFFVRGSDRTALKAWDRVRYFVAHSDYKELNHRRWHLMPWLLAFGGEFDQEVKRAIRELGGRVDQKDGDPDTHAAHLYRLVTGQELDMKTARAETKITSKSHKATKTGKGKDAKKAKSAGKSEKASTSKTVTVVTQKNAKQYDRDRAYDGHTVKRLTKVNPHRAGSTQAKRWGLLKKGMSVGEYVSKGGSRGTLADWISKGCVKLVRATGGGDSAE